VSVRGDANVAPGAAVASRESAGAATGPSTNGRRERLSSPLGLALTGVAFAVAFAMLAPSRDAFRVTPAAADADDTVAVDELRLAYLKARGASGELDADEVRAAVTALARGGRVEEARELLAASPAFGLDDARRLSLDVELAAGAARRAGGTPAAESARTRLASVLRRLLGRPGADVAALERGAELAAGTDDVRLAAAFRRRLAEADPARAGEHYARCARLLVGRTPRGEAVDCFVRARVASDVPGARFALGLELLAELPANDPDGRRPALVDELLEARESSPAELDALATVLLAIERPDAAARVYARLAENDPASRGRWLEAAARWSEAAGRPAEAAVFLDRMTPSEVGDEGADAHQRRIESLLVGAGRARDALDRVATRVAAAPDDADTVREAIRLAEGQGELARALEWNAALLVARPDDAEALGRQATLALALGRPALARGAAEREHALAPDDIGALERLAQLTEWDGDPDAALRHRRRLVTLRGDDDDLVQVARLAELVRRPSIAAQALATLAERTAPADRDIERLVRLHELDGRPDEAARALEMIMTRHGTRAWMLRELAALHARHLHHREALAVWRRFAGRFGRSAEETLARVELHWRLGEEDRAAALAGDLPGMTFGSEASPRQASLLAEIGWRYRLPGVAALARPLIASVDNEDRRELYGRREIDELVAAGDRPAARRRAEALWREEGNADFALTALRLATDSGDETSSERLLADTADVEELRAIPEYWSLRATAALRAGDVETARRAYVTALGIDADDVGAIGGLLWLHVGEKDTDAIATLLVAERERALAAPGLWNAFAVGHVTIGDAPGSLPWFERALDAPRSDYALLLTFADALEAAGRVDHALRVRRHAVAELRPRLLAGVAEDRETLLRQYGRVLARHGSADANEDWMRYVLNTDGGQTGDGGQAGDGLFWREDMAISWLMATERHEHARLIMARLHERRIATPVWQDLALALRADDTASVRAMLESGTGLSAGNRILALRHVGRDADAWALAVRTLNEPGTAEDRAIATSQYGSLRRFRPSYASALARTTSSGGLDVAETGFALRHTLGYAGIGVGLDVVRERLASTSFDIGAGDTRSRVALSLFRETSRQGFGLTAGLLDDGDDARVWGRARYARRDAGGRREVALELVWREPATDSAALRLGAVRSRIEVAMESAFGTHGFTRFSAEANEVSTRVSERRVASGLASRAELGLRGAAGGLRWSGSVAAAATDSDRIGTVPDELRLGPGTTLDAVLARERRTLSLNGSLARGGVGESWPDGASPRWFVNGGVSSALPDGAIGLQLDAGAGFRVLGNDELGIGFARDARLSGTRAEPDTTRFGIEYRHHF